MTDEDRDAPGDLAEAPTDETATEGAPAVATAKEPTIEPEPAGTRAGAGAVMDGSADALFEALWARVLTSWDEDKLHAAILEHALRSEMLPELAGRYRAEQDVPGHEARAKKRLDAIVVAATQMLFAQRTPKAEKPPWQLTASVALACVVVLVWLAFKVLR